MSKDFTDTSKNVGNEDVANFNLDDIVVTQANSTIGEDDITISGR